MPIQTTQHFLDAVFPVVLGIFFSVARLLIEKRRELTQWVTGLFVGAIVSYMTYLYLQDYPDLTDGSKAVIIGLSGLLSHDFLKGLLLVGKWWRENPSEFFKRLK